MNRPALIFAFIIACVVVVLFGSLMVSMANYNELTSCRIYDIRHDVIFEDNEFLDKCIIVEDREELTIGEWKEKHRLDGLEVRK